MNKIEETKCNFDREPWRTPFGFKGRVVTELWQTVARLTDSAGRTGIGIGTQSVLCPTPDSLRSSPNPPRTP